MQETIMQSAEAKAKEILVNYKTNTISQNLIRIEQLKAQIKRLEEENVAIEKATFVPEGCYFRN